MTVAGAAALWSSSAGPRAPSSRAAPRSPSSRAGPLVVFVHGAPDTSRSFTPVVAGLTDIRTVVYDRRGWGRSVDASPPATSIDEHVDDLLNVIGGEPATIVAHSFGCCVAMRASVRRPDLVRSLGLWEPPMPWAEWWPERAREVVAAIVDDPDPEAVGERLVRRVLGDDAWDRLPADARRRRRAEGRAFVEEAREQLIPQFDLAEIGVPCVVAVGSDTWAHMVDATRRIAVALGADLITVAGAGHFGHVTHPEEFAALARLAVEIAG